jgi:Right handed beta helix region
MTQHLEGLNCSCDAMTRVIRYVTMFACLVLATLENARAMTFFVAPGEVEIKDNGLCSLVEAIENANADLAIHPDCPAGSGTDNINLAAGGTYTIGMAKFLIPGGSLGLGLPVINSPITIQGSKSIIERSSAPATPPFCLIHIAPSGKLLIRSLTLRNAQSVAAAIHNLGNTTLEFSTVSGNSGGGIFSFRGTLSLFNTTITNNSGGFGGGIVNNNGTATIINSTISNNTAVGQGGGIQNNGIGAGTNSATLNLVNSTVSGNSSLVGGGIHNADGGTVTLTNSTVSGNTARSAAGVFAELATFNFINTIVSSDAGGGDCVLLLASVGTNIASLIKDGSCGAAFKGDPKLGPLGNNGGPTFTHALLAGSPAIDAGADCSLAPTKGRDQHGFKRDLRCDIGAVEFESSALTAVLSSAPNVSQRGATSYLFSVTYRDNFAIDMTSVNNDDVSILEPSGSTRSVFLVSVSASGDGTPRRVTYQLIPPNGKWDSRANGTYTIVVNNSSVRDTSGNAIASMVLGTFSVNIPTP